MLADGSEYRGHYAVDDAALAEFHRPRLQVLADAGADLLAFETIPCLREARVLSNLLREFPDVSAWISFSCRDGEHNCEGEHIGACAAHIARPPANRRARRQLHAAAVHHPLLRRLREATDKPLLAYPNPAKATIRCPNNGAARPAHAASVKRRAVGTPKGPA